MSSTSSLTVSPEEQERSTRSADAKLQRERDLVRRIRSTARVQEDRPPSVEIVSSPSRGREGASRGIIASAQRLTSTPMKDRSRGQGGTVGAQGWQTEAWELYDLIGEQRFLSDTLAGRMAQAAFYVGKLDPEASPGTRPEPDESLEHQRLLSAVGDGPGGLAQLVNRLGINLFNVGEGWLVGIPPRLIPGTPEHAEAGVREGQPALIDRSAPVETGADVLSMTWRMLSVDEFSIDREDNAEIRLDTGEKITASIDELFPIRIWRPHARRAWEANSPTRASLPILRELLGLTLSISAQIDSRLAGAGLLVISTEASAALKQASGLDPEDSRDPLMEALQEAMSAAIADRSSPAALVPITLTVPSDVVDKIKHITFSTNLDKEARNMRDEAIRRLALGQDAPPELLLGVAGMNHWGAWLVREDVVKTHLEPPLALIADALTSHYLRPVLIAGGMSEQEASQYAVWYDVDHLIERPSKSADAVVAYDRGAIGMPALRAAMGFEESEAPEESSAMNADPAAEVALQMVAKAPSLAQTPGLPALVEDIRAIMSGAAATEERAEERAAELEGEAGGATASEASAPRERSAEGIPSGSPSDAPSGTPAARGR